LALAKKSKQTSCPPPPVSFHQDSCKIIPLACWKEKKDTSDPSSAGLGVWVCVGVFNAMLKDQGKKKSEP
jgi:hypothetical protein